MNIRSRMTLIAAAVAGTLASACLSGCEVDDSVPSSPRQPLFNADEKATENAKKREEERRGPSMPTGSQEFPGQSRGGDGRPVITAAEIGPALTGGTPAWGTLPHLHTLPKDRFAEGQTVVPGIDYPADHSLGQVLPLTNVPHRAWAPTEVAYHAGPSNHNPTYYTLLADRFPNLNLFAAPDTSGFGVGTAAPGAANAGNVVSGGPGAAPAGVAVAPGFGVSAGAMSGGGASAASVAAAEFNGFNVSGAGNTTLNNLGMSTSGSPALGSTIAGLGSDLIEAPWFVIQTVILPVRMFQQHPWSLVQSHVPVADPLYMGYLPETGPIAPSAYPGEIRWTYPWVRASATQGRTDPFTQPAESYEPDMVPKDRP